MLRSGNHRVASVTNQAQTAFTQTYVTPLIRVVHMHFVYNIKWNHPVIPPDMSCI